MGSFGITFYFGVVYLRDCLCGGKTVCLGCFPVLLCYIYAVSDIRACVGPERDELSRAGPCGGWRPLGTGKKVYFLPQTGSRELNIYYCYINVPPAALL